MSAPVKLYFHEATKRLSDICDRIDSGEDLDEILLKEFEDANKNLAESIDRRKYVYSEAHAKIEQAKAYKQALDQTIDKLERIKDRIEANTMAMIEAKPNIKYEDSLGKKLYVAKNPVGVLEFKDAYTDSVLKHVSVRNVIDSLSVFCFNIDPKYIKTVSHLTLDVEQIKKDLKDNELSWVKLVHGKHLKGLKI